MYSRKWYVVNLRTLCGRALLLVVFALSASVSSALTWTVTQTSGTPPVTKTRTLTVSFQRIVNPNGTWKVILHWEHENPDGISGQWHVRDANGVIYFYTPSGNGSGSAVTGDFSAGTASRTFRINDQNGTKAQEVVDKPTTSDPDPAPDVDQYFPSKWTNDNWYDVTVRLIDKATGAVITEDVVKPGETFNESESGFEVPKDSYPEGVEMTLTAAGAFNVESVYSQEQGGWVQVDSAPPSYNVPGGVTKGTGGSGGPSTVTTPEEMKEASKKVASPGGTSAASIVWRNTAVTGDAAVQTRDFRQGMNEVVAAIEKHGVGGGSSTDMTQTNAKLDQANSHLDGIGDSLEEIKGQGGAGMTAALGEHGEGYKPTGPGAYGTGSGSGTSEGDGQKAEALAAQPQHQWQGTVPSGGATVTGGSGSIPANERVVTLGGKQIFLGLRAVDDSTGSAMGLLVACRPLILLAMGVAFLRHVGTTFQAYVIGMGSIDSGGANMGIENLAPGAVQAKSWLSATIVVVAIMAAGVALLTAIDLWASKSGVTVGSLLNDTSFTQLGAAWGFLDQYYPMSVSVVLSLAAAAMPYLCAPIYAGVVSVVKFAKI